MKKLVNEVNINTEEYLNKNFSGPNWRVGWEDADKRIKEEIELLYPKNILDVGCADGTFIKELLTIFPKTNGYGVDLSEQAIQRANENCPEGIFQKADCYNMPFSTNFFDIVHSSEVLEHLEEPEKALKEMNRVLMFGGEIIITTVNENAAPYEEHLWHWDLAGVMEMIKNAGFAISGFKPKFFNDSILYVKGIKID